MFNIVEIDDHVRVEPELFNLPVKEAVKKQLEKDYSDYVDEELGVVIAVLDVVRVGKAYSFQEIQQLTTIQHSGFWFTNQSYKNLFMVRYLR